jgi:hypothetical protein
MSYYSGVSMLFIVLFRTTDRPKSLEQLHTKVHTSLLICQSNGVHVLTFQLQGWQLYSGLVFNLATK